MDSTTGPYARAADAYWKKAWLPFPVKGKHEAIPKGVTGKQGKDPGWADIQQWVERRPFSNVAVRANGWIAIDVDGPDGVEALFRAMQEIGNLPETWRSTSWPEGFLATRFQLFFRVPVGYSAALGEGKFRKRFGEHVDIIHRAHRYSIVAPSVHPDTGNTYAWYGPDGQPSKVPMRTELPELPEPWLDFLRYTGGEPVTAGERGEDWYDEPEEAHTGWTPAAARAEIERMLTRIRTVQSNINTQAGGAMREIGRFVPALLSQDEAVQMCTEALTANPAHSDSWNAANGKDWTARTLAATSITRGMEEAREVAEPGPDGGQRTGEPAVSGPLSPPSDPMAVARELVPRLPEPWVWWRGDFYRWTGTHWTAIEEAVVARWLYRMTEHALYEVPDAKGDVQARRWAPTKKKIVDLTHALGVGVLQREGDADQCVATSNGVLGIADRRLHPHSPNRFNLTSLPFAYDAEAACPNWLTFLEQVLPGDRQAHDFLAEWFGYVLSGRTNQQKMAALIGKRRSGKGTVARVLGAMLGQEATAGLDLNLAAGTFGIENLIGRSLAISGDVRWQSKNIGDAVPILLGVIGEDVITIHRKNRMSWTGRLGVRFMLMSNETPTFSDRSGALGGRMVYVKFDQSFYGREDTSLTDKLLEELPGILNWALNGLDRLNGRGRFTEPESGLAEADSVRRLSDPIGAFIEDWCETGEDECILLDHLYLKYRSWCESEGRTKDSTTKEIFSRDLRGKVEGLSIRRVRVAGKQTRMIYGIGTDAM